VIATWGPTIIVVVAIAWGRSSVAVTLEESTPTRWAITIRTGASSGRAGVPAKLRSVVIIAIAITRRAIVTAEVTSRSITITQARRRALGTDVAFNKAAFEPAFEVTFKMTVRRSIGTGATIAGKMRTAWRRGRHVFVDEVGERHELFFAQLAVAVFIEFREQLFGLGHFGRAIMLTVRTMSVWAMRVWIGSIGMMPLASTSVVVPAALAALAIVTSLTMAFTHQFAHFLAGFLTLVVAQFSVAVFIELFDDFFPHLGGGGAVVAFLGVAAIGICGHG
jgi:hypothetical protein